MQSHKTKTVIKPVKNRSNSYNNNISNNNNKRLLTHTHRQSHRRTERHKLNETVGKNGLKAKAAAAAATNRNRNRTIQRTPYNLHLIPY